MYDKKILSICKVFGSDRHKYQLNPPISMEEVLKLEADFNIGTQGCISPFFNKDVLLGFVFWVFSRYYKVI